MQPPTDKVHQIIARTATFVSKHGGQSEIVLRVKQGDNPTFGFLMPEHNLHPYFRFLVDHQELLQSDIDGKTQPEDQMANNNQNSVVGGALSLLGSVYGSGEDEDCLTENDHDVTRVASEKTVNTSSARDSHGLQKGEFNSNEAEKDKDDIISKHPPTSDKEKAPVMKKNPSIAASKTRITSSLKHKDDSGSSFSLEKSKEPLMLEPPSDLKRSIDKIVEFIIKNGKQFETTLCEQDSKHGRFPFLLPSNQYHPYYLKVLQSAEKSKVSARNSYYGRDDLAGHYPVKKALLSKDSDVSLLGSIGSDIPFESNGKEKFKMVISKSKKDMQDQPSKATQQEYGISVDAAAAAAILQAATRGIKNPNLGIISSIALNSNTHGHGSEVEQGSNSGSQPSSQRNNIIRMSDQDEGRNSSVLVSQTIGENAASQTAGEADSSEAHLTREQKLKAERLKRAKMFVAKLKSGSVPSTAESLHAAEPVESGVFGTAAEVNLVEKTNEGSSVPVDRSMLDENENSGRKHFADECSERRSRRKYRSRSERHDVDDENYDEEDTEENHSKKQHRSHGSSREGNGEREKDEEERDHKHSKRRHQSHHSSYEEDNSNKDWKEKSDKQSRKKHRSHHPSHEDDGGEKDVEMSYHEHSSKKHSSKRSSHEEVDDKGDYEDEKYHKQHSRRKHRSHRNSHKRRKGDSSRDKESHRRSKHESSSDVESGDYKRYAEDRKESHLQKEDLEEGEISSKVSDQSRGSMAGGVSRETSMDIVSTRSRAPSQPSESTEVSDDLRAKIRAMLMATR